MMLWASRDESTASDAECDPVISVIDVSIVKCADSNHHHFFESLLFVHASVNSLRLFEHSTGHSNLLTSQCYDSNQS
jgi:hypothetical protein